MSGPPRECIDLIGRQAEPHLQARMPAQNPASGPRPRRVEGLAGPVRWSQGQRGMAARSRHRLLRRKLWLGSFRAPGE
ncbi:MAG: hypothetical protein AVDCRST_MAG45-1597 [uncultured Solirubrobacterales bacterium]|uniref:Uncharacterized protein n=1 Tax=uncultured Solirubrobacterales bacterium TaxID=768556 RepID=A0A6J4SUU9_9ACTN|nr:MAG: hypothetical protein AVDCRST_MAG45-1597 [uncultured Solirubrobacterales bacterium]